MSKQEQHSKPEEFNSATFYRFVDEHRLMGARCQACGALYLPPRPMCRACHGDEMAWVELSGRGKLAAFTTVHIALTAMIEAGYGRDNPYCAGIVQLDEGPAISAQILDVDASQPAKIAIGTPLEVAFIERGEGEEKQTRLRFQA